MTHILLIQPETYGQDKLQKNPSPPLSLLNISTYLQFNYEIKIIDERGEKNFLKKVKKELNKAPICVGITVTIGRQIINALRITNFIKENSPHIPVIWGGVFPSLLPIQTLANKNIDIIVKGDGEITFFELVNALKKRKKLKKIRGIGYKKDRKIIINADREFIDLNKLPPLPYHLIKIKRYITKHSGKKTFYLETSRGCPYACAFCYVEPFHKRCWRALKPQKVIKEVEKLKNIFGIENFWLIDDNFFVSLERTKKIMEGFKKLNITWEVSGSRADIINRCNENYLYLLEKSGCERISFGIESGSQRILNLIRKSIKLNEVISLNKRLRKFDITPIYNFMSGFPTETLFDLKKTIRLALKLLKENSKSLISTIKIFTPFPGTKLFEEAINYGFSPPSTLEKWATFNWDKANLPWITEKRKKVLEALYVTSLFLSGKIQHEIDSPILKLLAEIYKPIAFKRMEKFYFNLMPELIFKNLLLKE